MYITMYVSVCVCRSMCNITNVITGLITNAVNQRRKNTWSSRLCTCAHACDITLNTCMIYAHPERHTHTHIYAICRLVTIENVFAICLLFDTLHYYHFYYEGLIRLERRRNKKVNRMINVVIFSNLWHYHITNFLYFV